MAFPDLLAAAAGLGTWVASVPAPSGLSLLALGLAGLIVGRHAAKNRDRD